ncbi:MlaC/ttg2D family ABC transporter substrate-binding protein [Roseobacter sp. S98]|uniref:MlaC/ttg2D family ABC transporter substrate-binding protein n=1 Tax=Roseobacter algicola (ex Choi et al. 2025) (nom. illeg.) TaxID=3092138 RepID=UPI0035C70B6F
MTVSLTRRTLLLAGSAAALIAASPAAALTEAQARSLVDKVIAEIDVVIRSQKSDAAILRDLEKLFARYADLDIMAQYALGADGRSASAADKRAFTDAFKGYVTRKYGKRFRDFIGGRIEVESTREIRAGYEVKAKAYLEGQSPFDVAFHISDRSGRDLVFNIFIEGVNLLLTERTEIGAMLDQRNGNIRQLASDLQGLG